MKGIKARAKQYLQEHSKYNPVLKHTLVAVDTLTAMVEFAQQENAELRAYKEDRVLGLEAQIEELKKDYKGVAEMSKELKEQLDVLETYINDVPMIITPCRSCKLIDDNKETHNDNMDLCRLCCWFYDSQFRQREE